MNNRLASFALLSLSVFAAPGLSASETATVTPLWDKVDESAVIPAEIYGQFAEHLGSCIYGGLWVGENSPIPNTNGYRTDVLNALKTLKVPVMRWPGGCFADEYHWTDGVGPRENRPVMVNNNWGGTVEDNSFGTHEFFNLCELLGCEPYLSGNVGSGTVEELAKWVEYITAEDGPMAKRRKENGREKPWKLKYIGVGNESWGCGGCFTPEAYSAEYRKYQTYCRNFNGNQLYKIASGASDYDFNWTDVLMRNAHFLMNGLSLHYYTVTGWDGSKGASTEFDEEDFYWTMGKCLEIEDVINRHDSIMTVYDPEKKVAMVIDEWGTWWDSEPGTNPGHLYQQNTMRDALVAALSLNVFHRHTDRVRMTNIAQVVNVLQSMILTRGSDMVLTPTYYVFKMYTPHQNATFIPLDVRSESRQVRGNRTIKTVSATASMKDEELNITLTNVDLKNKNRVIIPLDGKKIRMDKAEILTAKDIKDHNDFGKKEKVSLTAFEGAKFKDGNIELTLPPSSVVNLKMIL